MTNLVKDNLGFLGERVMPADVRIPFQKVLARNQTEKDIMNFCRTSKTVQAKFEICRSDFWKALLLEDNEEYENYLKIIQLFYPEPHNYNETVNNYYQIRNFFREAESFVKEWQAGDLTNNEVQGFLDNDLNGDRFGIPPSIVLFIVLKENIPDQPNIGLTRQQILEFYSSLLMGTPASFAHQASGHLLTLFALLASRNNDLTFLEQILSTAELESQETFEEISTNLDFFSGFTQREKNIVLDMIEILRERWGM